MGAAIIVATATDTVPESDQRHCTQTTGREADASGLPHRHLRSTWLGTGGNKTLRWAFSFSYDNCDEMDLKAL